MNQTFGVDSASRAPSSRLAHRGALIVIVALLTASGPAAARGQTIFFVDDDAAGAASGSSWTDAFVDLQAALDAAAANSGDEVIRVAAGVYRPDTTALADPRDATFNLRQGVALLGGYAGVGAVNPDERDPQTHASILSGDIGVAGDDSDNCYHVVAAVTVDQTAVLDGFRIRKGNADGVFPRSVGAGIFVNTGSRAVIRECVFRENVAADAGGAARIINADPLFADCRFVMNTAAAGGGVHNNAVSGPTSAPRFERCRFEQNTATGSNGGGFDAQDADPVLVDCVFVGNTASFSGGGLNADGGRPLLVNGSFFGNAATINAGGGAYASDTSLSLVNCLFSGNTAGIIGGGVAAQLSSTLTVVNGTFVGNSAVVSGGGVYADHVTLSLANSISYFNTDRAGAGMDEGSQVFLGLDVVLTFDHNDVLGLTGALGGAGNAAADPLFVDADGADNRVGTDDDDLRLRLASPCIDAAAGANLPADAADLDADGDLAESLPLDLKGDPRTQDQPTVADSGQGPPVDMGALETNTDCDTDGIDDADQIAADAALDCNANGRLDACEDDDDGDGLIDGCDGCPLDADKAEPGPCGCGASEDDDDADGSPDCVDGCPLDVAKTEPGACGCGLADDDTDGDGKADCVDDCPAEPDSDADGTDDCLDDCPDDADQRAPGACGCGVADDDDDNDGTADCLDDCPLDPDKTDPGDCGCGTPETDNNADGLADCVDNCPEAANADQRDDNADGVGDACAPPVSLANPNPCGLGCGAGLHLMAPFAVLVVAGRCRPGQPRRRLNRKR